jgi:hypothetical protein
MKQRLLVAAQSILLGWATLLLAAYLLEHPLLTWLAPKIGANWFPTVRLMLDCSVLGGIGWLIGRFVRTHSNLAVAAFAVTLAFGDFGDLVEIRVPWLLRLAANALGNPRYLESLVYTFAVQALLFGSLIAGALFSRRPPESPMLSIR